MSTTYDTTSYIVNPSDYPDPECPPEDVYTLTLMGIKEIGLGKPFKEGDEPRVQFTLEFKIDAPEGPQAEWHDFDLIGWYSPILHYPEGATYQAPKMWLLTRALNGGTPIKPEMFTASDGVEKYDAAAELQKLFGKKCRSVITKSAKGWPKITGDPMPMIAAGARSRRGAAAPAPEPNTAADEATAAALFSGEPNF
ncbi:MAG: hypothetical protein H0W41_05460 [Chloroflexi bacterium]|nr:hypothetical protein [Chloroflexota bacterium]